MKLLGQVFLRILHSLWFVAVLTATNIHAQTITEFSVDPAGSTSPYAIVVGPDRNLWFAETGLTNRIGRITPVGAITQFPGVFPQSTNGGIALGPDGNLWFTETDLTEYIVRITPTGSTTEFSGVTQGAKPLNIVAGPDGNMWFTEYNGNRIGRITPTGVVTEFSAGLSSGAYPRSIAAGPDGNLWFTEYFGGRIGRITPAGVITEFSTGISFASYPSGIVAGPDGNLWFTENLSGRIGRITPAGVITEFSGLLPNAGPLDITVGPDGNLWFTENTGNRIGRITLNGVVTEYEGFSPNAGLHGITLGPDNNLWVTEDAGNRIGRFILPSSLTPTPYCTLTATPDFLLGGETTTLTASCTPAATSYKWTNTGFASTASGGSLTPIDGATTYTVTGSNAFGTGNIAHATVSLIFRASTIDVRSYVPAAAAPTGYVSFLRIINTGAVATPVSVERIGSDGSRTGGGQLTQVLPAGAAMMFSAQQVEAALGLNLAANDRPRIHVSGEKSTLEVQSFLVQPGGVFNEISGAQNGSSVQVSTYIPAVAAPSGYASYLRVINNASTTTAVAVAKIDPVTGLTGPAGVLNAALVPGAAITYSAAQIEAALGASMAASERPRLLVSGSTTNGEVPNLDVQSFLVQPGGAYTDISTEQSGTSVDVRSYMPAAVGGYTSYLRITNGGSAAAPIVAVLLDDVTGGMLASGTLIASLPGNSATTLTSSQIEAALGINISANSRPRLRITSPSMTANIRVQSFLLQPGGTFNEMSNAMSGTSVTVRSYIPAADAATGYTSFVRVINPSNSATPVTIALVDAATGAVGGSHTLVSSLPGGAAQTFSSGQIEMALGAPVAAGTRPRIQVSGSVALDVQSFLTQPNGAFTEVSGAQQ